MNIFIMEQYKRKIALCNEIINEYNYYIKLTQNYYEKYGNHGMSTDLEQYKLYIKKTNKALKKLYRLKRWLAKRGIVIKETD